MFSHTSKKNKIVPGIYQHYKGKFYEVIDYAIHTETKEEVVVYRSLYENYQLWIRPLSMFNEYVEVDGKVFPRFQLIHAFGEFNDEIHSDKY